MTKKILAFISAAVLLLTFSSCSDKGETYITSGGTQYLAVRDSDGNIVINDSGKLQVYSLNENGKKQKSDSGGYITEYIDFNGQVVSGNTVETSEMRFTLPNNFVPDENHPGCFFNEPYDGEIYISYSDDDIESAMKSTENDCEKLLESYGSEAFSYEKYTVDINSTECAAFKHSCISSEYYRSAFYYFLPYDNGYYLINCIINTADAKKVDFDKFAKSIELKSL